MNKLIETARQYLSANDATHLELVKYYNENCVKLVKPARRYNMSMRDNWCAMFTSVIAHKCGLSPDQFPFEVSVGEQVKIAKSRGSYQQNVNLAYEGDLIIYNWNGDAWADHVGFISGVSSGKIETVEGNYHGSVGCRVIDKYSPFIAGIIKL